MQKEIIELQPEKKVIGIKIRTSFDDELNPPTAKIGALVGRYLMENIAEKIPQRKNPDTVIVTYSNYESDEYGAYDYFIGEEVESLNEIPDGLVGMVIPSTKYLKLTSDSGQMPAIVIQTWRKIWETPAKDLGGQRKYHVDFEVYDHRATDPENTVFDIYLGIK